MRIITTKAADGGRNTEMTLEMTAEEAELFKQALSEGKLTHLGLTRDAQVQFSEHHHGKTEWARAEDAKRVTPKDGPGPTRRPSPR